MPLDAAPDYRLLSRVLRDPGCLTGLSPIEYSRLIDAARDARLLGWLIAEGDARGLPDRPGWLVDRLANVRAWSREYERAIAWEINRLERAFFATDVPWVLLKGAAYLAASLPPGRGRRVADIDVLVRERDLARVEQLLGEHGWELKPLDAYDERYYREWMHELPPMVHKERRSVVDVHHAILPRTSRLQPSSSRLFERAVVTASGARTLCPAHMVLHASAHLFHDGEIAGALRDLLDLHELLRVFGADDAFWVDLREEAAALGLTRPLYYALRYGHRWFRTPIPPDVLERAAGWAPNPATRVVMDACVERSIPASGRPASSFAVFALYVRSHWLRMPVLPLARHLWRKSLFFNRPRVL